MYINLLKVAKTNKKIIGMSIAVLFAANNAAAQATNGSNIEIYGVLDTTFGTQTHSFGGNSNFPATVNPLSPNNAPNSTTGLFNGGIQASRWGFRGTEDLGGGIQAFFTMESGFNLPSGTVANCAAALANNSGVNPATGKLVAATSDAANCSTNGNLFGRQAFVGLRDAQLGSVAAGLNYSPIFDVVVAYDPVQAAQLFSPIGFSSTLGGGGGIAEDTRLANSVKYTNKIGDFNVVGLVKMGEVAGTKKAQSGYALGAGYQANGIGVQFAYQAQYDGIKEGSGTTTQLSGQVANTSAYMLAAKYAFDDATLKAGYESITYKQPTDTMFASASGSPLAITNLNGYSITVKNFTGADQVTDVLWFGGDYNFTPKFNLSAGIYDVKYKASSDNGQLAGDIYSYSALADYHFTKRTDVYAGLMLSKYKGDKFPSTTTNSSNAIYGFGMRTKF